jgi:hypothetical protein
MNQETQRWRRFGPGLAVTAVAAMLVVGLFGVPLGSVLFVGLLLLCPLLMMGMHSGHDAPGASDAAAHAHGLTTPRSSPPGSDSDAEHPS